MAANLKYHVDRDTLEIPAEYLLSFKAAADFAVIGIRDRLKVIDQRSQEAMKLCTAEANFAMLSKTLEMLDDYCTEKKKAKES